MNYLITFYPQPRSGSLNVRCTEKKPNEVEAREFAELQMRNGATEVEVWQLYSAPKFVSIVEW